ncbi:oligosaccharide flippase family protein [Staphylococcus chromogenes]|uniref:oligosaccharide flippase family protein n=1 Tax=Staphylococcus chromogenes TaxID=46126 RepID=UPI002888A3E8|nr:oligosaccharide flippase family protein [Staphylococcus chromogenes]MDT0736748.1 oligosaccharide flippase family protein [Staphylococcus chromogenes]
MSVLKNKFMSDSIFMVISAGIAQLIMIASFPVISRLYSPSEFGVFTIFNNLALILIPIINARYDLLIINAKNDKQANILSQISLMISLAIILLILPISLVCMFIFSNYSVHILSLIVMLFLVSLTNIFTSYLNREKKYNILSFINILRSFLMTFLQIILGIFQFGSIGLMIGYAFSYIAGITLGYSIFKKHFTFISNKNKIIYMFRRYKNQLYFSTPSMLINSLSITLVVFLIGILYTNHEVGIYGMAYKILSIPVSVISLGLSKIFMQKAHYNYSNYGTFKELLIKFTLTLAILGLVVYLPILFINKTIVTTILGNQWNEIMNIMYFLIPVCFFRLVVSTISLVVIVFEKQKIEFLIQTSLLVMSILSFVISFVFNLKFSEFVFINSLSLSLGYILFYLIIFYYSERKTIQG